MHMDAETTELSLPFDRRRAGWWLVALTLAGAVGLFLFSFVGTFILGLFIYYGARPVNRRIQRHTDSYGVAATVTLLFIVVPVLALVGYTGLVATRQLAAALGQDAVTQVLERLPGNQQTLAGVLQDLPQFVSRLSQATEVREGFATVLQVLGTISTGLLHLTLALAFAFFLYRDGHRLQAWYRTEVGGRDTAAYSYLAGVDADLEVVYFGNVLTVLAVTMASIVIYNGYNLLAPAAVTLPAPTLLAVLTGLATFVPLIVGKIVYVPATGFLAWRAAQSGADLLLYPAAFLVVSFLLLDIVPQSIVRPYISGHTLHEGAVLFSYVLGAALFGWYGLFFGPFLLVLVVQFANIVLAELVHGLPVSPAPAEPTTLGTEPTESNVETAEEATAEVDPLSDDDGDGTTSSDDGDEEERR